MLGAQGTQVGIVVELDDERAVLRALMSHQLQLVPGVGKSEGTSC